MPYDIYYYDIWTTLKFGKIFKNNFSKKVIPGNKKRKNKKWFSVTNENDPVKWSKPRFYF